MSWSNCHFQWPKSLTPYYHSECLLACFALCFVTHIVPLSSPKTRICSPFTVKRTDLGIAQWAPIAGDVILFSHIKAKIPGKNYCYLTRDMWRSLAILINVVHLDLSVVTRNCQPVFYTIIVDGLNGVIHRKGADWRKFSEVCLLPFRGVIK